MTTIEIFYKDEKGGVGTTPLASFGKDGSLTVAGEKRAEPDREPQRGRGAASTGTNPGIGGKQRE